MARYDIVALTSNDLVTDQRMQRCLTSLSAAGHRCLLLGRRRPGSRPLNHQLPFAQERHRLSADVGKRFYWQLNWAHYERLSELRPRAVLVVDLDTMWAGARAAAELQIPWAYDAHELFTEQPEVARRSWIAAAWSVVPRLYLKSATAAYTVGDAIARELTARHNFPFTVVRNLPRARTASKVRGAGPFTVLYQGALNEGRGLEELIGAAARMPDIRVRIAGGGPIASELHALAVRTGAGNVDFLGELLPEQLHGLTPQADLGYALMRRAGLNYYLSLSNKSLDYIQARLPSLQMAWPEYSAIQVAYGCYHLVSRISTDAVVEAIRRCRDASYLDELRRGCAEAATDLTWEREELRLLGIWREVLPS